MRMVDKALAYTRYGFEVGALDGKRPITPKGFKSFTTNPMQIRRWWAARPNANIGCRPPKWAVVLDVDPRNGGVDTWEKITGQGTYPTDTLVTLTGSGGWHVWYKLPYAADMRGQAGAGIDVKHHAGQVVMPGSIHPDTGKPYECVNWVNPGDLPTLPRVWWPHVFHPPKTPTPVIPRNLQRKTTGAHLVRWLADAQDGSRNMMLFWAVCRAVEHGYDILPDLAATAEQIGLPPDEVARTITSAKRQTKKKAG